MTRPFDFAAEMGRIRAALDELGTFLDRGPETLRHLEDFAERCAELADRLRAVVAGAPPLEPGEFVLRVRLPVRRPGGTLALFAGPRDIDGNVVEEVEQDLTFRTGEVHWAANSPVAQVVREVPVYVQERAPDGFRWVERLERRTFPLTAAVLPQEPGLFRTLSRLYRQREAELLREVLDLAGFLHRREGEVGQVERDTADLRDRANRLRERLAVLPRPGDTAVRLEAVARQLSATRDAVAAVGRDVAAQRAQLQALREQARREFPELDL